MKTFYTYYLRKSHKQVRPCYGREYDDFVDRKDRAARGIDQKPGRQHVLDNQIFLPEGY